MSEELVGVTADELTRDRALAAALLDLNNAHAIELSWLEPERLKHLVGQAFLAHRVGLGDALLLAFDQDADYDGVNFLWFRERFPRFVYVDRVVVAATARGRGLAKKLYLDLFEKAKQAGHDRIVCEVNSSPPNPGSDAFHAALGFVQIGTGVLENGKTVSYLERRL